MSRSKKEEKDEKLYDFDIRREFVKRNLEFFTKENTYLINEMKLNSKNIIDMNFFDFNTNTIIGFEIKSERDNTKRLEGQLKTYTSFCNIVYVICHEKHLDKVQELIDSKNFSRYVGIIKVDNDLNFTEVRKGVYQKPFFDSFIRNLDCEELASLCEDNHLVPYGTK